MSNIVTLRPRMDSSTPTHVWPVVGFAAMHHRIYENILLTEDNSVHKYTYVFKRDDPTLDPRFIQFKANGTWVHNNTGNTLLDRGFAIWFKRNLGLFSSISKYAVLKESDINILAKFFRGKLQVYFVIMHGQVIHRPIQLAELFDDRDSFMIPPEIAKLDLFFQNKKPTPVESFLPHLPKEQAIAIPTNNNNERSIPLTKFEALAFTHYSG